MRSRGIALLTGLILLAAISLLALSAASGMMLQRNMSINLEENAIALQNASIASHYALAWLNSRAVVERESGCVSGCLLPVGVHPPGEFSGQPQFEGAEWWRTNAITAGYNPNTARFDNTPDQGAEPARWLIEEIHYQHTADRRVEHRAEGLGYYRIMSRGTGRNARSVVVIETIAARPWDGDFQPGAYPPEGPGPEFCDQFEGRYDCGRMSWRQLR